MNDESTLKDYNIRAGSVIHLALKKFDKMRIFVILLDGNEIPVEISLNDKIKFIKSKINMQSGIPEGDQQLNLGGRNYIMFAQGSLLQRNCWKTTSQLAHMELKLIAICTWQRPTTCRFSSVLWATAWLLSKFNQPTQSQLFARKFKQRYVWIVSS